MFTIRRMAEPLAGFEEKEVPSGRAIWGNVPFPLVNEYFLTGPVEDRERLHEWVAGAVRFATKRRMPWMLAVSPEHLPEGGNEVLSEHGLVPAMSTTYMTCGELLPPVQPLPAVELRPVRTAEEVGILSDLNCAAYAMPQELGRKAFASTGMLDRGGYAALAYVDGEPVSTAAALFDHDCLNVACVATAAHQRRRGYAEATMRHVLEEASRRTGITRTVLHATPDGFPIYRRMGYQPSTAVNVWALVEYE